MRVLHVTDCYLPRVGGIEMHVHDLVRAQRAIGHDARVATATPRDPAGPPDPPWVHRVGAGGSASAVPSVAGAADLTGLLGAFRPDVLHAHVSVVSPFAMSAARRASLDALPTLVTVHSLWSRHSAIAAMTGSLLGLRDWPILWSAVSHRAAEPLRTFLGPEAPLLVLPNAVDPDWWRTEPAGHTTPTIVSVMRLARRKRPLPLARMLRQVRAEVPAGLPLRAVIVGDGPRRASLERYLDRNAMSWVEVRGRLERTAIRRLYAEASVYVAPATRESFGIAALEARCAGLPVIASTRGGVGEFITSGVDGVLAEDDAAMVAAMVGLVTDGGSRARMTAHSRTLVPGLDWAAACAASLDAYALAARIASGARPRVPSRTAPGTGARR